MLNAAVQSGSVHGGLPMMQEDLARLAFWHPRCFQDDRGSAFFRAGGFMKTSALMLGALLAAGVAAAQSNAGSPAPAKSEKSAKTEQKAAKPATKAEEWKAEVVSVDKDKKEITLKLENEVSPKKLGLSETAAQEVGEMKAGEQVMVTVHENEKGEKVAHHVRKHTAAATKSNAMEKKPAEKKSPKPAASPASR
jgi:hypothetical protein